MNWQTSARLPVAPWLGLGVVLLLTSYAAVASSICNSVVEIDAGAGHTCGVMEDSTVQCWGYNDYGQLGDGGTISKFIPVVVPGLSSVRSISAGFYTTCAVLTYATARCWGYNGVGQLGDGTSTDRYMPVAVSGLSNVRSISVGSYHTCSVLGDRGVQCWGAS
jgi:alpha-tubulin suppressor-like RCC1 family protein